MTFQTKTLTTALAIAALACTAQTAAASSTDVPPPPPPMPTTTALPPQAPATPSTAPTQNSTPAPAPQSAPPAESDAPAPAVIVDPPPASDNGHQVAQVKPAVTVRAAKLHGRVLRVKFACGSNGDVFASGKGIARRQANLHCANGAASASFRFPKPAARALARGAKVSLAIHHDGIVDRIAIALRSQRRSARASDATTVGVTCSEASYAGGAEVIGIDDTTTFGQANVGDTVWTYLYLYQWNGQASWYNGGFGHYTVTAGFGSGGYVTSDGTLVMGNEGGFGGVTYSLNVPAGMWTYVYLWTWTQSTGWRPHWLPATSVFAPARYYNGYCGF